MLWNIKSTRWIIESVDHVSGQCELSVQILTAEEGQDRDPQGVQEHLLHRLSAKKLILRKVGIALQQTVLKEIYLGEDLLAQLL